jgi:hypothetical protein
MMIRSLSRAPCVFTSQNSERDTHSPVSILPEVSNNNNNNEKRFEMMSRHKIYLSFMGGKEYLKCYIGIFIIQPKNDFY